MKMIFGTEQNARAVVVDIDHSELKLVNDELMFHRDVVDRIGTAMSAAGVSGPDIVSINYEFPESFIDKIKRTFGRMFLFGTSSRSKVVPVRRARVPESEILRG